MTKQHNRQFSQDLASAANTVLNSTPTAHSTALPHHILSLSLSFTHTNTHTVSLSLEKPLQVKEPGLNHSNKGVKKREECKELN